MDVSDFTLTHLDLDKEVVVEAKEEDNEKEDGMATKTMKKTRPKKTKLPA